LRKVEEAKKWRQAGLRMYALSVRQMQILRQEELLSLACSTFDSDAEFVRL
jgi:hypothetical protein